MGVSPYDFEIIRHPFRLSVSSPRLLLQRVQVILLFRQICVPDLEVSFHDLIENLKPLAQGHPFEAGHELVDQLVDFVRVGDVPEINFDIVEAKAALSRQVFHLYVEGSLVLLGFGCGPHLGVQAEREVIVGLKALEPFDRILDFPLQFTTSECGLLAKVLDVTGSKSMMRPAKE